jgi:hypothetical protein
VVNLEVVNAEGPVTLLAKGLALSFASFIGADPAAVSPHNHKVPNTVESNLLISRHGQLPNTAAPRRAPFSQLSSRLEDNTHNLPPEVEVREGSSNFLVKLPGVLDGAVQEPGDDGPVPFFAANLDAQVIDILVKPVHAAHAVVVPLDDVRLRHIQVLLCRPGVSGAGGEGLCPQEVADHRDWRVVIPPEQRYIYLKNQLKPFSGEKILKREKKEGRK